MHIDTLCSSTCGLILAGRCLQTCIWLLKPQVNHVYSFVLSKRYQGVATDDFLRSLLALYNLKLRTKTCCKIKDVNQQVYTPMFQKHLLWYKLKISFFSESMTQTKQKCNSLSNLFHSHFDRKPPLLSAVLPGPLWHCAHTSLLANFQCLHRVVLVPFCIIYSLHLIAVWFL